MKADELMIGDWVNLSMNVHMDIYTEEEKKQIKSIDNVEKGFLRCTPIPLTEQMLKLNGFYHSDREGDSYYIVGLSVFVIPNQNTTEITPYLTDTYFYCRYVHELQHLLRLCGLTELADNFKIE